MSKKTDTRTDPTLSALAAQCKSLLASEKAQLRVALRSLQRVREQLVSADMSALTEALDNSAQSARATKELHQKRQEFRALASCVLGVAHRDVTVSFVARHLPAHEAAAILRERGELQKLAAEVSRINHGNAVVTWWCLDFVQKLFSELEGSSVGCRYTARGKATQPVLGSTWQGKG